MSGLVSIATLLRLGILFSHSLLVLSRAWLVFFKSLNVLHTFCMVLPGIGLHEDLVSMPKLCFQHVTSRPTLLSKLGARWTSSEWIENDINKSLIWYLIVSCLYGRCGNSVQSRHINFFQSPCHPITLLLTWLADKPSVSRVVSLKMSRDNIKGGPKKETGYK